MLNFAICDDNLNILDKMSKMLESIFTKNELDAKVSLASNNVDKVLDYIYCNKTDVLFLDINLRSSKTGLEIAEAVRQKNKNIYINIFAHDDFIDIHIRDEGMGISKKDSKNIFERFIQSDKSLNRKNEGSGIGLSIVKSIIELHNGHISVDSQMNIGTTFKIILPKIGEDTEQCSIFNINNYNTELELSDIYEVLI